MRVFKTSLSLLLLLVSAALSFPVAADSGVGGSRYRLGSGDVIKITVFGEEDLSMDQIILDDAGTFSYPFIGTVQAKALTSSELESVLIKHLKGDYLIDPRVSISIVEYRKFFINGEVEKPGGYSYSPGMTLRQATATAGGLTERASLRRITIIRDGDPNREPKPATLDTVVYPGDIITIDQGFF